LLFSVLLLSTACAYRYRFDTGRTSSGERVSEWRHTGIWGWIPASPFDLEAACPDGVARFGSHINFLNWLPGFLTLGLYAPRTVWAECAVPESPEPIPAAAPGEVE
jgi:hypothetical protein